MHPFTQGGAPAPARSHQARPAAPRRRQLIGSIQQDYPPVRLADKLTHKLPQMLCVLWLRDRGGYLQNADLASGRITTTPNPDEARRLPEDEAEAMGQDVIDATGVRIELRPYRPCSSDLR